MNSVENSSLSIFKYRSDIDGLRALAIIPVLLHHAHLDCLGGYAGVDVFFIISGYVISSIILREVAAGTFTMVNFWERRIRRIMPALSMVVAAVLTATWWFCLPEDFQLISKSLLAQALMVANFYFWKGGNYFELGAETNPLLHTWSLALEEQFYLLFPLLLMFLIRSRAGTWQQWILSIAICSFIIGVVGSYSSHNQRAAFYLLPGRAWELLLGALMSIHGGRFVFSRMVSESLGFLGLTLILFAVLVYDESTRFPGLAALAPCLGSLMIIASSNVQLSVVGRLLSFRPFILIGLVSYPLYLWHWPILVFARYLSIHELTDALSIQLLLASLLLAVLSWKFVETPIRQRRWLGEPRQIFKFAGLVTGVFFTFVFVVFIFQGFPSRFPAKALSYAASRERHSFGDEIDLVRVHSERFMELGSAENNNPISLLLWGDSHAKAIAPALDQLCRKHSRRGVLAAHSGTPPVLNYICTHEDSLKELSPKAADSIMAFIVKNEIKNVVLAARWALYPASAEFKDCLILTVRSLLESGTNVVVIKAVPTPGFEVPRTAFLTALRGDDIEDLGITKEMHRQLGADLEPTFAQLVEMGATVLDPSHLFLNSRGIYGVIKNDKILYYDSNHLTIDGAEHLIPLLKPLFQAQHQSAKYHHAP